MAHEYLANMNEQIKYILSEEQIPDKWYNIQSDLPWQVPPPLHPGTKEPAGPELLAPIFPMGLIGQEVSSEKWIQIPDVVRDIYRLWRPTPLYRARALEAMLGTPAKIFYKYEGVSPSGSHKPNTAVAQVYYNKQEGTKRIATETGAGQWGSALSFACQKLGGIEAKVYMVAASYKQKPYRRVLMETWGATVRSSPSNDTQAGRDVLRSDSQSPGSLGIAISEAVEDAAGRDDTKYSLGSVLNHVLMHQTVIGQEAIKQMEMADAYPDVVIGCAGGGSNFAGIAFPFIGRNLAGETATKFIAVEPEASPSLTRGKYAYDFGDIAGTTPLLKMHTLGHGFIPNPIHAGGLRYHGMAPLVSALVHHGIVQSKAYHQLETFAAAADFAKTEGILPAPEPAHAIRAAIDEAMIAKETGESKTILFHLCGHGHFDLSAYENYMSGNMVNYSLSDAEIENSLKAAAPMV